MMQNTFSAVRRKDEDINSYLEEREVGDPPFFDEVTQFWICHVPGGLIYKNEYVGAVFVPYTKPKKQPAQKPLFEEQKIEKPVKKAVVK